MTPKEIADKHFVKTDLADLAVWLTFWPSIVGLWGFPH
mgnify:CR=1 FL=1